MRWPIGCAHLHSVHIKPYRMTLTAHCSPDLCRVRLPVAPGPPARRWQVLEVGELHAVERVGRARRDEPRGRRPFHVRGHRLCAVAAKLDVDETALCRARGPPPAPQLVLPRRSARKIPRLLQHPDLTVGRVPHLLGLGEACVSLTYVLAYWRTFLLRAATYYKFTNLLGLNETYDLATLLSCCLLLTTHMPARTR